MNICTDGIPQKKKPASRKIFGGIDFYGISSSQIRLPKDIPKVMGETTISYLEKRLKPFLELQLNKHRFYKIKVTRFIKNKVYVVVDVSDRDFKDTLEVRSINPVPIQLSRKNRGLFERWQGSLRAMWLADRLNPPHAEKFIKKLRHEEEKIRETLAHDTPLILNIKKVLRSGKGRDLEEAAMLCHWTPKKDKEIAMLLSALVLHPNLGTRNNASRSLLINYSRLLPKTDIKRFFVQLQLPFHSDRNKALYVLSEYSKLPQYRKELRQHLSEFKKLSKAIMPNIVQPAARILKNLLAH